MAIESYSLYYVRQTEKAVCFSVALNDSALTNDATLWLPKSKIEVDGVSHESDFENLISSEQVDVYVPDWLAKEKGLI